MDPLQSLVICTIPQAAAERVLDICTLPEHADGKGIKKSSRYKMATKKHMVQSICNLYYNYDPNDSQLIAGSSFTKNMMKLKRAAIIGNWFVIKNIMRLQRCFLGRSNKPTRDSEHLDCPLCLEPLFPDEGAPREAVYLRRNKTGHQRGYHAKELIAYINSSGKAIDPMDREELSQRELRRLDYMNTRHKYNLRMLYSLRGERRQRAYRKARDDEEHYEFIVDQMDVTIHNACVDTLSVEDPAQLRVSLYRSFYMIRRYLISCAITHGRATAHRLANAILPMIREYHACDDHTHRLDEYRVMFIMSIVENVMTEDIGSLDSPEPNLTLPPRIPRGVFIDDEREVVTVDIDNTSEVFSQNIAPLWQAVDDYQRGALGPEHRNPDALFMNEDNGVFGSLTDIGDIALRIAESSFREDVHPQRPPRPRNVPSPMDVDTSDDGEPSA